MVKYETFVLGRQDQKRLFGHLLNVTNGFVSEPDIDWWNILEYHLCKPVVSVRPSGRPGWNEILVLTADGFIDEKNEKTVLDYKTFEELITVLANIFVEIDTNEKEVLSHYTATCSKEVWKSVEEWVSENY